MSRLRAGCISTCGCINSSLADINRYSHLTFVPAKEPVIHNICHRFKARYGNIALWSPFAPVKSVNVKKVVEATALASPFGFVKHGEYFALTTSIRPWQLKSIDAFVTLIQRLAFMADDVDAARAAGSPATTTNTPPHGMVKARTSKTVTPQSEIVRLCGPQQYTTLYKKE